MSAIVAAPAVCRRCRKPVDDAERDELDDDVLHAACAAPIRARREEERLNAIARGQCRKCHGPLGDSPTIEMYEGHVDAFHAECWERIEELDRERQEHARQSAINLALAQTNGSWERSWYGTAHEHYKLLNPPRWDWARFDHPEFVARVNKTILRMVSAWEPSLGSLVISGPTGCGKTSCVTAWLQRRRDAAIRRAETEAKPTSFSFAFVTGHELVGARRNSKLGSESPLVELAKEQRLLILDEVGYERFDEVIVEVVDHRNRAESPTIVTTGLKQAEFIKRYGDSMYRKLTESGALIEGWK